MLVSSSSEKVGLILDAEVGHPQRPSFFPELGHVQFHRDSPTYSDCAIVQIESSPARRNTQQGSRAVKPTMIAPLAQWNPVRPETPTSHMGAASFSSLTLPARCR